MNCFPWKLIQCLFDLIGNLLDEKEEQTFLGHHPLLLCHVHGSVDQHKFSVCPNCINNRHEPAVLLSFLKTPPFVRCSDRED